MKIARGDLDAREVRVGDLNRPSAPSSDEIGTDSQALLRRATARNDADNRAVASLWNCHFDKAARRGGLHGGNDPFDV